MAIDIDAANEVALERINQAQPVLKDVRYWNEIYPDFDRYTILHAGPPVAWQDMCGPMRGAVLGAIRFEGLAKTDAEAEALIQAGKVTFRPNHDFSAVGPMTGIITYSMPVYVVENEAFGNVGYCTINEGLGKVMRFGANDDEVLARLRWIRDELAPALKAAIQAVGSYNLKVAIAQALAMGDELHQRNIAGSALFARTFAPQLSRVVEDRGSLNRILDFVTGNEQWFLNLAMAAGKAIMDPVRDIEGSTVVTAMSRNGTNFGIRVSGLGDRWFEAPVEMPQGLYFPGYTEADANPDMGDSTIVETFGVGGFAMGSAPAVTQFVGAGTSDAAFQYTRDMAEITVGQSTHYRIPTMNFRGVPSGIDVRKVVETGILPIINTGIAHKKPGVGQVGAGLVTPPMACFEQALVAFAEKYGF